MRIGWQGRLRGLARASAWIVIACAAVAAGCSSSTHDGIAGKGADAKNAGGDELLDSFPELAVDHESGVAFSGEDGGAFVPASQTFRLANQSTDVLHWNAESDSPWLVLESTGGVIGSGASMDLAVSLDLDRVFELDPADYSANVNFRRAAGQPILKTRTVTLSVLLGPPGVFSFLPQEDFRASGPVGGPFAPDQKTYTLHNSGSGIFRWAAVETAPWISVIGDLRGKIRRDEERPFTIGIEPALAAQLPTGTHHADVTFLDLSLNAPVGSFGVELTIDGSNGWTNFTASPDTRKVYVSSSTGSDAINGLTPATPKATIAAGVALLRHTYPDWLLLKTGDTWDESLGQWKKSGRSATERMVVTTYGTSAERPKLRTGTSDGLSAGTWGGSPPSIDFVAFVGLHFQPNGYTGSQGTPMGIAWRLKGQSLLVEDCKLEGYYQNVVVEPLNGRFTDFSFRRSVVVDAFTTSTAHAQGMYLYGIDGVLLEENVFDHNGWKENVAGAAATIFRHNVYMQSGTYGVRAIGNIFANGGSHGLQLRSGGLAKDNLFLRNSVALLLGGGNTPDPAGVTAEAVDNVIMDGKNIDSQNPRGWGIDLTNVASALVTGNVIANQTIGEYRIAMNLYGNGDGIGVHNTTIERNIVCNWGGPIVIQGGPPQLTGVVLRENDLQEYYEPQPLLYQYTSSSNPQIVSATNIFYHRTIQPNTWTKIGGTNYSVAGWKAQVGDTSSGVESLSFVDPDRTVAEYNASIGGVASYDAFMAEARKQSKSNWRPQYTAKAANAYLRQGFVRPVN